MNKNLKINSLLTEGFFTLRLETIGLVCEFNMLDSTQFKSFLNALVTISRLNTSKFDLRRTCAKIILSFYVIQLTHNSDFVRYLFQTGSSYSFPTFVHSYLKSIAMAVASPNKLTGNTTGEVAPNFDFYHVINKVLTDDKFLIRLLKGTMFESLLYESSKYDGETKQNKKTYNLEPLREEIMSYLSQWDYEIDNRETDMYFKIYCNILSDFQTVLYYSNNIDMHNLVYTFCEQVNLSVFRYRNVHGRADEFYVQQTSFSGVGIPAIKHQVAFLTIFSPQFSSASTMISGDFIIDCSVLNFFEAWKVYFKMRLTSVKRPAKNGKPNALKPGKDGNDPNVQFEENLDAGGAMNNTQELDLSNGYDLVNNSFICSPNMEALKLSCDYSGFDVVVFRTEVQNIENYVAYKHSCEHG